MLIIGRRAGDSILLGPDVEIRIIDVTPSRVKLGIIAPRCMTVLRGEMKKAAEQNLEASLGSELANGTTEALARLIGQLRSSNSEKPDR